MIYLYDNAIVDDLFKSFNPNVIENPVVKVVSPEHVHSIAAQVQDDKLSFPIVALTRNEDTSIDTDRINFTRMHKGVASVLDTETNELYYEKAVPIKLSYDLTILTTNTADRDELVKEIIFKYTDMYFLTVVLPYYCKRKIRFGIIVNTESDIKNSSGNIEYIEEGKLYQSIIPLKCEGCVLVSYTPAKLKRTQYEVKGVLPNQNK